MSGSASRSPETCSAAVVERHAGAVPPDQPGAVDAIERGRGRPHEARRASDGSAAANSWRSSLPRRSQRWPQRIRGPAPSQPPRLRSTLLPSAALRALPSCYSSSQATSVERPDASAACLKFGSGTTYAGRWGRSVEGFSDEDGAAPALGSGNVGGEPIAPERGLIAPMAGCGRARATLGARQRFFGPSCALWGSRPPA